MKTNRRMPLKALIVMMTAFVMMSGTQVQAKESETIHKGIYADSLDLSGLTKGQALTLINDYVEDLKEQPITLVGVKGSEIKTTAGELGLVWKNTELVEEAIGRVTEGNLVSRYKQIKDLEHENISFPIQFGIDEAAVTSMLEEHCEPFNIPAVNASLVKEGDVFSVTDGQTGYKVDVAASVAGISDYMSNQWSHEAASIDLAVVLDAPKGSAEDLEKVRDVLGTFTTSYSTSGSNRSGNISTGCNHINGVTLYPGESFSVLEAVTPFTKDNGYYMAGSYLNGQVVDSLGGGICQVSTTLYNALLLAEMQIDERFSHSMIVSYVDPSADAAIAADAGKDLKFTNNTDYPIYIEGITEKKKITFNIYGVETRKENREVSFESVVLETISPGPEQVFTDGSRAVGYYAIQSAHTGYKAQYWKIVKEDGVEIERTQINSSNYKMTPRQATFGTATSDPNVYTMMTAALATNNIDHIKQVASTLAAGVPQAPTVPAAEVVADPAALPGSTPTAVAP